MTATHVSTSPIDLFADTTLENPYPAYAELREQGDAVWMSAHDLLSLIHI